MKIKHLLTALVMFLVVSTYAGDKPKTIVIKTNIYCDHCRECGTCAKRITHYINDRNEGIKNVDVSAEKNAIRVTYDPALTNPDKIRAAINNAGYDADGKPAYAEGYSKLDGCCVKK